MANPFIERPLVDRLLASPLAFFLHPMHILLLRLRGAPHSPSSTTRPIRVVCISDTHTLEWHDIPDGDLLIHAGDLSNDGSVREIQATVNWLKTLPHRHKIVIAGNHDSYFDPRSRLDEDRDTVSSSLANISASTASIRSVDIDIDDFDGGRIDWSYHSQTSEYDYPSSFDSKPQNTTHEEADEKEDIHYLQHTSITLTFPAQTPTQRSRTLTIYGAPQIPTPMPMGPEHAFTYPPAQDAWTNTIPIETDILVTHTPPYTHRDLGPNFSIGCPFLLSEVWRVRPILHVFGHVHFAHGSEPVFWDEAQRAWERISGRCSARQRRLQQQSAGSLWAGRLGGLYDLVTPRNWIDAFKVLFYGVTGIIWSRVWGGQVNRGAGWMVNAAMMYKDTGILRNKPQCVEEL
ncbi:phosphoric ester hydrolase, putative [Talaromyces stipitatus ATCC 10500]|uniref:Phosphoric ester hydrolase, putative n=1 Tax=Talaromyces stipitatus (strain ATCC 10500 / CBS 375.48 / QM 6759 / NRRL 1006) TaxID=441959 RepID=B8MP52_TALSN|nr:phosphoric ester hydrolase, putative [Talaromyces stipitatus ATCC 10500]EED14291.1 phosphoric ester hydrolase, putative [Talaromyces stipitatus ATCC 10500]